MQPSQLIFLGNKVLDDPAHGCPKPCRKGNHCSYNGYCSFVHPGEQGIMRKFFPAHTIQKDGKEINVRARVILCASDVEGRKRPEYAAYYQRKEQQLSWPAWMKKQGLSLAPGPLPTWEQPKCIRLSYIAGQISDEKEFLYTTQEERLDALENLLEKSGSIEDLDAFYSETGAAEHAVESKKKEESCVKGCVDGASGGPGGPGTSGTSGTPEKVSPGPPSYASIAASKPTTKESIHQTLLSIVKDAIEQGKEAIQEAHYEWTDTLYVQVTDEMLRTLPLSKLQALLQDTSLCAETMFNSLERVQLSAVSNPSPATKKVFNSSMGWGDVVC